ncbi:glycosyltransferase, partial [Candidatus Microgenomates bacterium]|nr:glycosyltransferase [Candidatus Microgenomates bacterium]
IMYILEKVYATTYLKYFFPLLRTLATFFEGSFVRDALDTLLISHVHVRYIKQRYGITPQILHLGVKSTRSIPKKRGNALLSFGRWQKEKNPAFLLKLIKKLPSASLIIAGTWIDTADLEWFKKRIERENLAGRVHIIPSYSDHELEILARQARLFLHPHFEAFGLAALEAAGYGLPIIIPKKSGVTEIFSHEVHGFFPQKVALSEYHKHVTTLLGNEQLAYRMGLASWKRVKKDFSWKAHTQTLLHIIHQALNINGKRSIIVLETGHALGAPLAGGDRLMEPMAKRLVSHFSFTIIAPAIGALHWKEAPFPKTLKILPQTPFDKRGEPLPLFIAYCNRMWHTYKRLRRESEKAILYSSTNILPDVLPIYFAKHRTSLWIARVHHLIPPPYQREGKLIVNTVSYLMQLLSLWMIKSRADVIIALNEKLREELQEKGFPKNKLRVLGAGIDSERITSQKILAGSQTFDAVYVGRLHPTKGIFDLVPIWKEVTNVFPKATLGIIGKGSSDIPHLLSSRIKEEGLSKNIYLVGFLPDDSLYSVMKRSKVFLFTDHEAGWGIAAAEAMAAGLPTIGWDIGILGTVFKAGFRKAPLQNYERFSKEIINLLQNEKVRRKLAQEAKREARQLDWEVTSKKFSTIVESIKAA